MVLLPYEIFTAAVILFYVLLHLDQMEADDIAIQSGLQNDDADLSLSNQDSEMGISYLLRKRYCKKKNANNSYQNAVVVAYVITRFSASFFRPNKPQ